METISAHKIAKEMGVSHVSVYRWLKSGEIKAREFNDGPRTQYEITREDYETFRKLRDAKAAARRAKLIQGPQDGKEWFDQYREIFGAYPDEYTGFRKGTVTVEMAQMELFRRIGRAQRLLEIKVTDNQVGQEPIEIVA